MTDGGGHTFYISIGSNVEHADRRVNDAIRMLCDTFDSAAHSSIYTTKPLGGKNVADYTNAVVRGISPLDFEELNPRLKEYERKCGRTPEKSERGEIEIDLDIVVADGEILRKRDFDAIHFQKGYREMNP